MKLKDIRKLMNIPDETGAPICLIDEGTDTAQIPGSIAVNYDPAKRANFHGTCAAWIAYKASLAEIHCFRYGRKAALRYCAEHGIRLVSYSMRSTDFDVEEAEIIKKHGIIFVAAAGNSGSKGVEYPAKNDLTIAVAAYDPKGQYIEPYSSKGPEVDYTAYTDWLIDLPGGTHNFDGTSAAAPVIAGCLSIYLKYHPNATVEECREFLKVNSKDLGPPGLDEESGWGLFRFPKNDDWKKSKEESKSVIKQVKAGAVGFDTNTKLTTDLAKQFKEIGYDFTIRYVSIGPTLEDGDLTAEEVQAILGAGLGLMVVQHVRYSGWLPTAEMGQRDGGNAVNHGVAAGIPAGVTVVLDLEGVKSGSSQQDIMDFCNAWHDQVAAAGYVPMLYVGANSFLSGNDLYHMLKFKSYWKSMSNVPDVAIRGYQMVQEAGYVVFGISIDRNVVKADNLGDLPFMLIADEAAEPEPVDPCANCAKYNALLLEKSKLFEEVSRLRQIVNQASGVLAQAK